MYSDYPIHDKYNDPSSSNHSAHLELTNDQKNLVNDELCFVGNAKTCVMV